MNRRLLFPAVLVALILMLADPLGWAWQGVTTPGDRDLTGLEATREVLGTVSRLRGLDVKQPVKSGFKTQDEIEQTVIRDLDENNSPEEFRATQKTLARLGLLTPDFDLRDYVIRLLREQVAGFYEPKTREFYLAAWLPISEQRSVIAHELVHALQDQHFDLRRFEKWPKGDSDAELAIRALIEGDATIVMFQYAAGLEGINLDVTRIPPITDALLSQDTDNQQHPVLAAAPQVLRETLQFPYLYGAGFVQHVLKRKSWAAVNEAYQTLPASTSQIMHPEKFLAGIKPVKIALAGLSPILGDGWKQIDTDVMGEFGYLVTLSEFLGRRKARNSADGWKGDRYALYENTATGDLLIAQFTTWETPRDAREFFDAYCERTEKRYSARRPQDLYERPRMFETAEGIVSIDIKDGNVLILEAVATRELALRLTERLWTSTSN